MNTKRRHLLLWFLVILLTACGSVNEISYTQNYQTTEPQLGLSPISHTPSPKITKSPPTITSTPIHNIDTSKSTQTPYPYMPSKDNCPMVVSQLDDTDNLNIVYNDRGKRILSRIDTLTGVSLEIAQFQEDVYPLMNWKNRLIYWIEHDNENLAVFDLVQNQVLFTRVLPESLTSSYIGGWTSDGRIQLTINMELVDPIDNRKVLSEEYALLNPENGALIETVKRNYDLPGAYVYAKYSRPNLFFAAFQSFGNLVLYNTTDPDTHNGQVILWDAQEQKAIWKSESYKSVQAPYITESDEMWSPDGKMVAYIAKPATNPNDSYSIFILNVKNHELVSIPDPDYIFKTYIPYIRWSPDYRYLHIMGWLYPRSKYVQNGYLLDVFNNDFKTICHPTSSFISGTFITSQMFLFLASPDESTSEIWLLDVDNWKMKRIASLDITLNDIILLGSGVSLHDY